MTYSFQKFTKYLILTLLFTLAACGGGGGGGSSSPACDPIKIAGGQSCEVSNSAVVKLIAAKNSGLMACTGAFVSSNLVITSGHCLVGANSVAVEASNGATTMGELLRFHPSSIQVPALDYGVVVVPQSFISEARITPLPIFLGAEDYVVVGAPISLFGFGREEGNDGFGRFPRVANMTVTEVGYSNQFGISFAFTAIPDSNSNAPGFGCVGDSGGPAIVVDPLGIETGIVGILSGGIGTNGGCSQDVGRIIFTGVTCRMVRELSQFTNDLRTVSACI